MKTLFNSCLKHPSSILQAMLDASSMPCSIDARGWHCGLRTPDFGLRTPDFDLRFSVSGFRLRLQSYLLLACLVTASRSSIRTNPNSKTQNQTQLRSL
jgi:hypothetical protein